MTMHYVSLLSHSWIDTEPRLLTVQTCMSCMFFTCLCGFFPTSKKHTSRWINCTALTLTPFYEPVQNPDNPALCQNKFLISVVVVAKWLSFWTTHLGGCKFKPQVHQAANPP